MKSFIRKFMVVFYLLHLGVPHLYSNPQTNESVVSLNDVQVEDDNVIITFSKLTAYDVYTLDNPSRLVVEVPETSYKASFARKDVSSELIRRVRGYQFKETPLIARVILDLKAPVDYRANAEGNQVIISLTKNEAAAEQPAAQPQPRAASSSPGAQRRSRTTDLMEALPRDVVTLDFESADIKDVIRLMSETSNINMIFGPEVSGSITVHLRRVPFDEAFRTILNLKGLVATQLGSNILRITTPTVLATERSRAVTITKTFPINYLKAQDMSTHIQSIMSSSGRRGTISVVAESNSLVVTDSEEGLDQAARLIAQLDKRPKQVMIEARLVEINLSNGTDVGVQWEGLKQNVKGQGNFSYVGLRAESEADSRIALNQGDEVFGAIGPSLGTGVNLPGPTAAGITFGFVRNNQILSATLAALITQSRAKILSSPKVVTINGQEAKIEAVSQIPFRTSTVSGTGVVSNSFTNVNAGIVLTVTPTINSQDRVTLVIKPESSFPTLESTEAGPVIRTRNAQTTVIVKDGDTLVIGGLIDDRDSKGVEKVPLLGDIPIIGTFFRRTTNKKERNELLVFVTPRIIRD